MDCVKDEAAVKGRRRRRRGITSSIRSGWTEHYVRHTHPHPWAESRHGHRRGTCAAYMSGRTHKHETYTIVSKCSLYSVCSRSPPKPLPYTHTHIHGLALSHEHNPTFPPHTHTHTHTHTHAHTCFTQETYRSPFSAFPSSIFSRHLFFFKCSSFVPSTAALSSQRTEELFSPGHCSSVFFLREGVASTAACFACLSQDQVAHRTSPAGITHI